MLLILGISSPPRSKWHTYTNPGRIRGPWPGSFLRGGRLRKFFLGGGGGSGERTAFRAFCRRHYWIYENRKPKAKGGNFARFWTSKLILFVTTLCVSFKIWEWQWQCHYQKEKKNRKNWVANLIIHYVCCWFPRTSSPRFKRPRKGKR